jgi:hypothetical protein
VLSADGSGAVAAPMSTSASNGRIFNAFLSGRFTGTRMCVVFDHSVRLARGVRLVRVRRLERHRVEDVDHLGVGFGGEFRPVRGVDDDESPVNVDEADQVVLSRPLVVATSTRVV